MVYGPRTRAVTSDDRLTDRLATALFAAVRASSPRLTEDAAHLESALDTMLDHIASFTVRRCSAEA